MARKLSRYNDAIRQRAVVDAWDTSTNSFAPISYLEYLTSPVLAAATFAQNTSYPFYTVPNDGKTWQLVGVSYRFTTQASSAATFDIEVAAAATAPGSGTSQTGSGGLTLQGTANTTINGTISTQTTISPGTAINFKVSNAQATTGLVGLVITLSLQRIT